MNKQLSRRDAFYLIQGSTIQKHGVDYENVGQDLKSQRSTAIPRRWNIMQKV